MRQYFIFYQNIYLAEFLKKRIWVYLPHLKHPQGNPYSHRRVSSASGHKCIMSALSNIYLSWTNWNSKSHRWLMICNTYLFFPPKPSSCLYRFLRGVSLKELFMKHIRYSEAIPDTDRHEDESIMRLKPQMALQPKAELSC